MSVFTPGADGTMESTNLPGAMLEIAVLLDQAENARNGANPSLSPKQNVAVTVDMGSRTVAIAATIPAAFSTTGTGTITVDATDYLGSTYTAFAPGTGGSAKSTDIPSAFVEIAQMLASAEKSVQPVDDQPNNVTIAYEQETQAITIAANLPITTSIAADGSLSVSAIDYL